MVWAPQIINKEHRLLTYVPHVFYRPITREGRSYQPSTRKRTSIIMLRAHAAYEHKHAACVRARRTSPYFALQKRLLHAPLSTPAARAVPCCNRCRHRQIVFDIISISSPRWFKNGNAPTPRQNRSPSSGQPSVSCRSGKGHPTDLPGADSPPSRA